MKRSLAIIMIIALMMQMASLGVIFGDDVFTINIKGQEYELVNGTKISKVTPNQNFYLILKLEMPLITGKYKLTVYDNSSFVSPNSKNGSYTEEFNGNTPKILLYYKGGEDTELDVVFEYGGETVEKKVYMDVASDTSYTPPTSRNEPKIVVAGGAKMPVVNAGEEAKIYIPLENLSTAAAKNIQATLVFDSSENPFEMEKLSVTYSIDRINGKDYENAVFNLKVLDSAVEKIYPVTLKYYYSSLSGTNYEGSDIINIKVTNSKKPPKVIVSAVSYGDTPLTAGEQRKVSIVLRNNGALDARDIKVTVEGLRTDGFTLYNSPDVKQVQDLPGNKVIQLDYVLIPALGMATGNYDLHFRVDYKDSRNTSYSEEFTFFFPVKGIDTTVSDIKIENIEAPDGDVSVEESFIIAFDVVNYSDIEADGVRVNLITDDHIICKSLNIQSLGKLAKDERKRVEFELYATSEAVTKNYPVQINVEFENGVGDKKTKHNISQYVGVFVDRGGSKGTPRIIVDRYNVEPSSVKAGDVFQLTMSLLNTSSYATVNNIKVSLISDDGVFSPVNSSNTIYIESIGPKESVQKVFTLTPKRDAEHKTYGISVNIEYEDDKGNQYNSKDIISVNVIQQAKLVLGDLVLPPEVYVGQTFPISIEFYNMGKTTLYNLMIRTEGNFTAQNSNYYVGNFEPGSTDYYDAGITPLEEGMLNGRIIFTFENAVGEVFEEIKEIQANAVQMVMEPMPEPGMGEGMPEEEESKIMRIVKSPYFIAGTIILVLAAFFVIRKVHNKKKGMTFDE